MPHRRDYRPGKGGALTWADYAALPDDGQRYQLVEGELVVSPSPTLWHQEILQRLNSALLAHVGEHRLGRVFFAPLDVILSDRNVLQPDLLFVSNERSGILEKWVRGAPDLCVEIVSPSTSHLDRVRKMRLYARFGVPHYWIVDPEERRIEEYVLQGDVYGARSVAGFDETFRPALFPGLELTLRGLPPPPESD